jgi:hypothetical protein
MIYINWFEPEDLIFWHVLNVLTDATDCAWQCWKTWCSRSTLERWIMLINPLQVNERSWI